MAAGVVSGFTKKSSIINLEAPLETVFPLFGPIREKEWADGWEPEVVHATDRLVAEHMVFTTKPHFDGEPDYCWTISKYQPEQAFIEYTVFALERMWWISIQCRQVATGEATEAEITYSYVGLSAEGTARNQAALENMYRHQLKDWEEAINHYLATGRRLEHRS